ncbi:cytochrome P450 [Mycobacterium sp. E3339]|uniref:cytochrome P450 n=1 Tax=Mycobacterium sp. E3339 TaxID=1834146 RepID=UPI0009EE20EA|nr:cytochrome P450 [Mycobacterium sp. E3339]
MTHAVSTSAEYFLALAETGAAVVRYKSTTDTNAFLACEKEAVRSVFRAGAPFASATHPYRATEAFQYPLGHEWLGLTGHARQKRALIARVQAFFDDYCWFQNKGGPARGRLAGDVFYLEAKAMCLALSCQLLFDLDIGDEAYSVAPALDTIEEARASGRACPAHNATAGSDWSGLITSILRRRGKIPTDAASHAVTETLLSATVPMAYAFLWTLLLLGGHQTMQLQISREATSPATGEAQSLHTLRTSWAAAAVKESLRLYPPVWAMSRTSTDEQSLAGMLIHRGEAVVVSPYALHRLSSAWPHPHLFNPARFDTVSHQPQIYMPFGAGARTCPAAKWNMPLLALALRSFLREHFLEVDQMPRALPLVALRPDLNFLVEVRAP